MENVTIIILSSGLKVTCSISYSNCYLNGFENLFINSILSIIVDRSDKSISSSNSGLNFFVN